MFQDHRLLPQQRECISSTYLFKENSCEKREVPYHDCAQNPSDFQHVKHTMSS